MIKNTDEMERLYLSKGEQTIYIDNCNIPQHHIDGIRFLYRQYKKKKPGVIINDRSGYNKNLQIVLFIKSICHLLKKPVLVLCDEGTEHNWMEQFQTWTDFHDDIVLETQKPHIKKQVLINTLCKLPEFCRREWSILVIDSEEYSQVLWLPFKADYKIWVTSSNLKKNLNNFAQIYKWLYPKRTFDHSRFTPDKNDPIDVVDKAILLDAFFEDIVITTKGDPDINTLNIQKQDSPPVKVSRKNKDATGKKIKRSKRIIYDDDDDDDDLPLSNAKATNNITAEPETNINENKNGGLTSNFSKNTNDDSSNEDMPTENIGIPENDATISNVNIKRSNSKESEIKKVAKDIILDSADSQNQIGLYYEPDTQKADSDRLYELDTLPYDDVSQDLCNNEHIGDNKSSIDKINQVDDEQTKSVIERDIYANTRDNSPEVDNEKTVNEILNIIEDYNRTSPTILDGNTEIVDDSRNSPSVCNEMDVNNDFDRESPSICDDMNINHLDNNVVSPSICEPTTEINEVHNELNKVKTDTNEVNVTNTLKRNCMEDRIKEMEEKALKKFKGSILDSLF